ncbi:MAG: alpha/beta fold hydrolase, partial [Myxococcota bacterium]
RETLFVHFGGPGDSAVTSLPVFLAAIPASVSQTLTENFALLALDEIGVGESEPIQCSIELTDYSESALVQAGEDLATDCAQDYPLFDELGTVRFARDIERLRGLLEIEELNFLTYSYGTQVALTYAAQFPERAGRLVLDSPIDPRDSLTERAVAQSTGFGRALDLFFDFCDFGVECTFGNGNAEAAFDALYLRLSAPARLDDAVSFEAAVTQALYFQPQWTALGSYLESVERTNTVPALSPQAEVGAFFGTTCTDFPISSIQEIRDADAELQLGESVFRRTLYSSLFPCLNWGSTPEQQNWETALPTIDEVLLAGASDDPVTPREFSDALEPALSAAQRVRIDSASHAVSLFGLNSCLDDAVLAYLLAGTPPPDCE